MLDFKKNMTIIVSVRMRKSLLKGGSQKMYKLKYKNNLDECEVYYFNTIQEVFDEMMKICDAGTLADAFKTSKEYNLRFYLTYKKD